MEKKEREKNYTFNLNYTSFYTSSHELLKYKIDPQNYNSKILDSLSFVLGLSQMEFNIKRQIYPSFQNI